MVCRGPQVSQLSFSRGKSRPTPEIESKPSHSELDRTQEQPRHVAPLQKTQDTHLLDERANSKWRTTVQTGPRTSVDPSIVRARQACRSLARTHVSILSNAGYQGSASKLSKRTQMLLRGCMTKSLSPRANIRSRPTLGSGHLRLCGIRAAFPSNRRSGGTEVVVPEIISYAAVEHEQNCGVNDHSRDQVSSASVCRRCP
jgi:hypothetical protein